MLTSFRGLMAVSLAAAGLSLATPAMAQDEEDIGSGFTASANVALTTDYRFRGVSLSGGDPAVQGGFDVAHDSGFYIGTWASSIKGGAAYGDLEVDIYAGWGGNISDAVSVDIGVLYYIYPTETLGLDTDYIEPYASIGVNFGPADATFGIAYAPSQDSLGNQDNLYLYTDLGFGIPDTPLTVTGHLGYTDGALAPPLLAGTADDSGLDWSLGVSASSGNFEFGVAYVGTEGPSIDGFTDDAIVGTLSASF
ncbi:TorF family putative porin [Qipengyuania flava]|uniref:TorF family putative porin n=1 Tax=Qipengyuania flava TaxID=192812 RepID=UPI001C62C300|nr:TorF family putative porin [Qipengyuania flava]QYJ07948.1 TorF family putative porin [Qipengyuania flava]